MDLSFLCTGDQKQTTHPTDSEIPSVQHRSTDALLPSVKTKTKTAAGYVEESNKALNYSPTRQRPHEISMDSDCFKPPSSNLTDDSVFRSEPGTRDNHQVHAYFGTAEPVLPHVPHQNPISPHCQTLYDIKGVPSFTAEFVARSSSPLSISSESDTAMAPESDLYIAEPETYDFTISPNVNPYERKCRDFPSLFQTEIRGTSYSCDTNVLMCHSDVLTQSHHSSSKERTAVDCESDTRQCAWLRPPVANASKKSSVSVNDEREETAGDGVLNPQARQSDSPVELWLDACQYLGGEDAEDMDVLEGTSHSMMQEEVLVTSDLSFVQGGTQESGYDTEGIEGIGWSCEETRSQGPPVERWSSVDSWATALSDWPVNIAVSPEDITPVFAEIGAEIDALTQALADVTTDTDREISRERKGEQTEVRARPQPNMGNQDQPLDAQNIPETSVLSEQGFFSSYHEVTGSELEDTGGSQSMESLCDFTATGHGKNVGEDIQIRQPESLIYPIQVHTSDATTAVSPEKYGIEVTAVTKIPKSTSSADLKFSQFGVHVDVEREVFMSNNEPIVLNITEDSDLEGQGAPGEPLITEISSGGLYKVTDKHSPDSVDKQEAKKSCELIKTDGEESDLCFFNTLTPIHSHVPGEDRQPVLSFTAPTHVSLDTFPDLDRTCQVEPQWGSLKFIMPLAPLTSSSSLVYRTASSLEDDQIRRSLNDNRGTSCDHVQPCDLWPTADGIPDKLSLERHTELNHKIKDTIESAEKYKENLDLYLGDNSETASTKEKQSIIEEFYYPRRGVTNFEGAADNFLISEESRVAILTLGVDDPFVPRPIRSEIGEKMPHKSHKHHYDGKSRCKKDKSAGHHHGAPISKTQENVSQHISVQQKEVSPPTGDNVITDTTPAEFEELKAKLVIDTSMTADKAPGKHHGKKKKKHGQNTTAHKTVEEPPVDEDYGAKPKSAKGKIDMFEAKLGAKAVKVQRNSSHLDGADKKLPAKETNASQVEPHLCQAENKDYPPKKFQSSTATPIKEDTIKKRRLSEDKFGKILNILESKLPKPDVDNKGKKEEPKADAVSTSKKAYSEAVKQNITPKEEPKVVQPIQALSVSGDPQSLCLWCQFGAVFCDYTVTWSRDSTVLSEIKRSAGDESRVSFNIVNASHKDLGKYQCRLSSPHGSVTLDYLLTYEVLSEIVIPPSPQITPSVPVEVASEEEDVLCSRLLFKEDFLSDQYFGDNQPVSIITEKVHFGEGMHRRAFRTKLNTGQMPFSVSGHCCVLKVHNAISYGTKNNEELIQKNFTLAVEECQVQNTAREYIRAYSAAAESTEAFGEVPEIIPIYLVHRPSNDIPYATLEEELIGDFVKYSVKDGKEINQLRRDSVAGQKCCAFQHWVYHHTEGNLLVTDMQGVGMKLTDVGIATCRKGYKGFKGNCSTSFIDQFKALHQCNMYCEILGLDSLQPKPKKPSSAPKSKPQPPGGPKKKTFGSTLKSKS